MAGLAIFIAWNFWQFNFEWIILISLKLKNTDVGTMKRIFCSTRLDEELRSKLSIADTVNMFPCNLGGHIM